MNYYYIKTSLNPNDYVIGLVSLFLEVENSDVQAWARSPKPAQVGPGKLSQAQAMVRASGSPRLGLNKIEA